MIQVKFKTDQYGVFGSRGYLLYVNKWGFFSEHTIFYSKKFIIFEKKRFALRIY